MVIEKNDFSITLKNIKQHFLTRSSHTVCLLFHKVQKRLILYSYGN